MDVPAEVPAETTPEALPIVAMPGALLLQIPPEVELLNVLVPDTQAESVPEIGAGEVLIVTGAVVKQPVGNA